MAALSDPDPPIAGPVMTRKNRRNYYRILFVQPDAPLDVIKASYRALMGPLKHHPDLGGDHQAAALINEAYQVLRDPVRREAYARTYRAPWARAQANDKNSSADWNPADWVNHECCPFCQANLPKFIDAETDCERCRCPLSPPIVQPARAKELIGRRAMPRIAKTGPAILYRTWQSNPTAVRLRDLSTGGLSLYAGVPITVGQAIRVAGALLDAVAQVVSCRQYQGEWIINGQLLTARFAKRSGVFVSDAT
jgi:curved DNA-binding protein CbpA